MNKNVLISVVCFLTAFLTSTQALAITAKELADICEALENNIQDIYIEFEWGLDPPPDINGMPENSLMIKGPEKITWATKRPFGQFSLSTHELTLVNQYEDSHNETIKQSYNGKIAKRLQKASFQGGNDFLEGLITRRDNLVHDMQHTPAGFSILRFSVSKGTDRTPLSELLRDKEVIRLDDNIVKINGFNAIKVDILTKTTNKLWGSVYFSVEHGYTPVRYEYRGGGKEWAIRYNVTSFERISDGLWFPKSAYMEWSDRDRRTVFTASKISLNQGLGDEFFDLKFPPGTRVYDETLGLVYRVGATSKSLETLTSSKLVDQLLPIFDGIDIEFRAQQAQDRKILVCFWDMNQRPSRNCIIELVRQSRQLKDKGVIVITVHASNIDEKTLDEWVKKNNIPFPVGMIEGDENKARFTWGVRALPWLILTDKKHIVQAEGFAIAELDERIEEASELAEETLGPGQHKQQLEKTSSNTVGCKYLLYLPEGYGQKEKKWPMILFLHGAGERGDDLSLVEVHGLPKIVQSKKNFPFVVVSPQCPTGGWWSKQHEVLINLLDEIIQQYDVDENRIYLTGLSMGGYGSWSLGCEYPDRFAAIAPICGGGEPLLADRLKNLPVWAFHGAKDKTVPLEKSELMVEAVSNAGGDVKLTVYPEAGHDSWTETYNSPELYEWFLRHRRKKDRNNQPSVKRLKLRSFVIAS